MGESAVECVKLCSDLVKRKKVKKKSPTQKKASTVW